MNTIVLTNTVVSTVTKSEDAGAPVRNRLLRLLPERRLMRLMPLLERVEIRPHQILHHWNMPMEHVYFIEHGLVSVSAKVGGGSSVEVWLIGCEGMTGVPAILSDHNAPPHRRVVHVGGKALRISIQDFHHALREVSSLRDTLLRYVHVVLLQATQSGACNANHLFKQRLARWLLTAREALQADEIPLTHLVLGRLLGVRRASVTECLSVLESEEAIHSARGVIRIVDSRKLESISCDCHRIIKREYERVFSH
jgi:CRP-like cAMP-binding protein